MKRRQFLSAVGITPLLALAACEKNLPSTPTIVTGKVTDENNLPVEGIELQLIGSKRKGLSPIPTFNIKTESDKGGNYNLSQVISSDTDYVAMQLIGNSQYDFVFKYSIWVQKDSSYEITTSNIEIQRQNYGKTNTFNFQIRKQ